MPNQACCWRGAWLLLIVAFTAHQAQQCHGQVTGEVVYNAPGTYTFTPPSGVTSVSVVCVAAGGGSGTYLGWPTAVVASGGGGGGLVYGNNMPVSSTASYTVVVGAAGRGPGVAGKGGNSYFVNSTFLFAEGGTGGQDAGGAGGNWTCSTADCYGNLGGTGGWQGWDGTNDTAGGGGGAGGYEGWGAWGGSYPTLSYNCTPGDGCPGGGALSITQAGGGGGVGLFGTGPSGLGGTSTNTGGQGGSGGSAGSSDGTGGRAGGGAGGRIAKVSAAIAGGDGACRIVWPGDARFFPSTNVGPSTPTPTPSPSPPPPVVVAPSPPPPVVVAPSPPPPKAAPSPPPPVVVAPSPPPPVVVAPSPPPPVVAAPSPPPPVVVAPSPPPPVAATPVSLDHRLLVLSIPNFTNIQFLQFILDGYGIPYDVVQFNQAAPVDPNTFLFKPDGSPKYSAILMYPTLELLGGAWNKTRSLQLETYQKTYGVRIVRFGATPDGFGLRNPAACTAGDAPLSFTPAMPLGVSGVKRDAAITADLLYRCPTPANFTQDKNCILWSDAFNTQPCNITSVLEMPATPALGADYAVKTSVGVQVDHGDGRQSMAIFMDCAPWQPSCMVIGHVIISWLAHDIIPGQRRAMLSTHIDDVFLSTALYNRGDVVYRMSPADYNTHASWQDGDLKALMAPNSNFKVELVYNGNGVLFFANDPAWLFNDKLNYNCQADPQYLAQNCTCFLTTFEACTAPEGSFCKACSKTWRRAESPTGDDSAIPASYSSSSWLPTATWLQRDPLASTVFNDMAATTGTPRYFWMTHTFTHQNLNNASANDAGNQWTLNQAVAARLGIVPAKGHSVRGVTTPQITGLFNINNYQQMVAAGYNTAVGDNTWDVLKNLNRPLQMLTTTVDGYSYAGFNIMPRFATEVYFNVNDTATEEALYNFIYFSFFQRNSNINEIMERESLRVVRDGLLRLKFDPHMFHQANMGTAGGTTKSLLQRWVEAVVTRFRTYTNWPIESLKMDDLIQAYLDRAARDACNLSYTLNFAPGSRSVTSVSVKSNGGSCTAPLLVAEAVTVSGTQGPPATVGTKTRVVSLAAGGGSQFTTSGLVW